MVQIRKAQPADCRGLAEVQVASYRTSYAAFFPPAYFEQMTYAEQEQDWLDWLAARAEDILLVAMAPGSRLVGYALARAGAEIHPGYDAEIMALHVRADAQHQGTGTALLAEAVRALAERGCHSVMLWTIQGNPVRAWYEALGGQLVGEKRFDVDGWEVVEVAYGWPAIGVLLSGV